MRRLSRGLGWVARDERGFVLVFLAVAIPAVLGLVGLVLDGTRFASLDTELAGVADAAALAAASRLDRSASAISRAREAAIALGNAPDSATAGMRLRFRFAPSLSELRGSSSFSLPDEAGAQASVVEVRTEATSLTANFLGLLGIRPAALRRGSVAESAYYACDVTPAVLCQPDPADFVARAKAGNQYRLRLDGNTVPGSIALLDRPDAPNSRQALLNLASDAPPFCYADGVRLRTNIAPAEFDAALNVRFDRYVGRTGPIAPDLAVFPPAPNVIQGRHQESCLAPPQGGDILPPYPLPRDSIYQGFRTGGAWNQGEGDWRTAAANGGTGLPVRTALDEYLVWNHADKGPAFLDLMRAAPTRYDLYLAELGLTRSTANEPVDTRSLGRSQTTMPTGGPLSGSLALRREHSAPVCYSGYRPAMEARRRILYLSVADCGRFTEVSRAASLSRTIGRFFLTEPADSGAVLAEFQGFVVPRDDDGKLRHVVQLVDAD